jgi:Ala-tRNA(Pro) deacylase
MALSRTLESFLGEHHAVYALEHHALALSSLGAARAAHVDEHLVAKSVLLEDDDGPVLAVLPAACRLELSRLREQTGRPLHFASEDDTVRFFPDCALGALPPVGIAFGLPTVVDRSFETLAEVFFEAGDHETFVRMEGSEFLDLMSNAKRAEIASEAPAWVASRRGRERLHGSTVALHDALTAPIGSGDRWRRRLRGELLALSTALSDHIAQAESCDGLLRQIEQQAPRLSRAVEELREEHVELAELTSGLIERVETSISSTALRSGVLKLLGRFVRHRHNGADLVYEAYGVDIGGG